MRLVCKLQSRGARPSCWTDSKWPCTVFTHPVSTAAAVFTAAVAFNATILATAVAVFTYFSPAFTRGLALFAHPFTF
jgi:hypothetical protein